MRVLGSSAELMPAVVRYVEAKALLGGVTTAQGIALFSNNGARRYYRGLVRNVESTADPDLPDALTRIADVDASDGASFLARLKKASCPLLHLSEGANPAAHKHFEALHLAGGVVERGEVRGGCGGGVAERGEEPIGAEAAPLDADGAHAQRGREVGMLRAGDARRLQLDQGITGPEVLDDLLAHGLPPVTCAHEAVAVPGRVAQGMEQGVAAEAAVEEDHRVVGERDPHPAGQREFAGVWRAHGGRRQQMLTAEVGVTYCGASGYT